MVNDISLGNLTYFNRINERSAFAVSIRYFSLGEIEIIQDEFSQALIEKPNEMTMDISYSLRLADQFSMGVALRYLRSDLKIGAVDPDAKALVHMQLIFQHIFKVKNKIMSKKYTDYLM